MKHSILTSTLMLVALLVGAMPAWATELPSSFSVVSADVSLTYKSSTNTIQVKFTPADHITYRENGAVKEMAIDVVTKVEIYRKGKNAQGEFNNGSLTPIKTYENLEPGKTQVYNDRDILAGEAYTYRVRTYIGDDEFDHDYPDGYEIYTYVKPAAVADFAARAADDKGSLPVSLTGTVPSKTESGTDLADGDVTALVFERAPFDGFYPGTYAEIGRLENPAIGSPFSFADETAELNQYYSYSVTVMTAGGASDAVTFLFRTGQDLPMVPDGLSLVNGITSITLSWNPVTAGAEGGYVDAEGITYNVYNFRTNCYPEEDGEVLLKSGISGTTVTLDFSDLAAPQEFNLRLRAVTPAGESDYASFAKQIAGQPASLPWNDNFNKPSNAWGGIHPAHCWDIMAYGNIGSPSLYATTYGLYYTDPYNSIGEVDYTGAEGDVSDYNNEVRDGMLHAFYDTPAVDLAVTEPINFSRAKNPVLSFKVYQVPALIGSANRVDVYSNADEGDFALVGKANCFSSDNGEGWTEYFFPLEGLAGKGMGRIQLQAVAGDFPAPVSIDDVAIDDYPGVEDFDYSIDREAGTVTITWADPSTDTQTVKGYRVYIDGECPFDALLTDCQYTFAVPETSAKVNVVAHYDNVVAPASPTQVIEATASGVTVIGAESAVSSEYVDLQGRRIGKPSTGLCIKVTTAADGTKHTEKLLNK